MERQTYSRDRWIPWANCILIALNVLVFAAGLFAEAAGAGVSFMYQRGALFAPLLLKGQDLHRLVTAVFLHADAAHLMNNMVVQFAGGGIVERNLGHGSFALLYLASGIAGNAVSVLADYLTGQYGFSVGASGAVFGIMGALAWLILREGLRGRQALLPGSVPPAKDGAVGDGAGGSGLQEGFREAAGSGTGIPARVRSLLIRTGVMTAYLLLSGWQNPSINQAAHVGGFICGSVLAAALMRGRRADLGELLR